MLIHHHALSTRKQCPVRALARRVAHLHKHAADPDELLCAYFDHLGKSHVTNNDMLKLVRAAGVALQLEKKGFPFRTIRHALTTRRGCYGYGS